MGIDISVIKDLRIKTGAGVLAVKEALEDAKGNIEKAEEILKKQGLETAMKKSGRETGEGAVQSYIHAGNRIGSLVELRCETDFVARTEDFVNLARDLAMQVAAMSPEYISKEDADAGSNQVDEENILYNQPFIKDTSITIEDIIKEMIAKVGENIKVAKIIKFDLT